MPGRGCSRGVDWWGLEASTKEPEWTARCIALRTAGGLGLFRASRHVLSAGSGR